MWKLIGANVWVSLDFYFMVFGFGNLEYFDWSCTSHVLGFDQPSVEYERATVIRLFAEMHPMLLQFHESGKYFIYVFVFAIIILSIYL